MSGSKEKVLAESIDPNICCVCLKTMSMMEDACLAMVVGGCMKTVWRITAWPEIIMGITFDEIASKLHYKNKTDL